MELRKERPLLTLWGYGLRYAVLLVLLLPGCIPEHPLSRDLAVDELYNYEQISRDILTQPELFFCFDRDRAVLEQDLDQIAVQCLNQIADRMPEEVSENEMIGYRQLFEQCRQETYLYRNLAYFKTDHLFGDRLKACQRLRDSLDRNQPISP